MSINLNKVIEEINKATTIAEVKGVKVDGKDIFDEKEKGLYFTSTLITGPEEAKEVAILLIKIKKAFEEKKKDEKLMEDLEAEEGVGSKGSLAYRVLNTNKLVTKAIDLLRYAGRVPGDKTKRDEEIKSLEEELSKKRLEQTDSNISMEPLERQLERVIEERDEEKKTKQKKRIISVGFGRRFEKISQ